jgi:histidinol-phosphatase (PHP family)
MIVNLHTHTTRCFHAIGSEEEYVQSALDGGLKVLGFSDHTPYWFPGDYYSSMRMHPDQLMEYADTVRELQKKYKGQLEIPLGLEAEYYPGLFSDLVPRLRDAGIEYILLGQHWNHDEIGQPYNGRPSDDQQKLCQYCDQVIEAMQTGLFTYVAHPDILNYVGDPKIYQKHMTRICKESAACNIPLEINLLGIVGQRHYPSSLFWTIAAQEGCPVVLGSDAHRPAGVICADAEEKAMALVNELSLKLIERPQLKLI